MCTYLKFLKYSRDKARDSGYVELRKSLERDHKSFEFGFKTLSYLLSVKSHEIPYRRTNQNDIWNYFNGPLEEEYVEFLDDLDREDVEGVLVDVTHLLANNTVVGLGPIISKVGFSSLGKEFYSRTVALLVNLIQSSYCRFSSSFGDEQILIPYKNEMDSCEKVEEWRMNLLNKNLTFSLCRLTVAVSIFGTEEFGLFESFNELPMGLLGLFDRELWPYVIGSFPTLCFDDKFLFTISGRTSYIEVISDQYLNLIRSLIASKSYPYDYCRNKYQDVDNSEILYILIMCGWIDHLSNYVIHNLVLNNQRGNDNKVGLNLYSNWLSTHLGNRVVMDMIYTVFKFDHKLCFETLIRLSYFNENIMFIDNIIFKSDLKDESIFSLLYRLDLEIISKDQMSLINILNFILDGVKCSQKSDFLRLWKLYLSQYSHVKLNLGEINKFLYQLLKYLFENGFSLLKYSEDHFNPDSPFEKDLNKTNKGSEEVSNVEQVLLHRNLLIKLVEILGYDVIRPYKDILLLSLEEGYKLIGNNYHNYNNISKIEFSLFLIYFLDLKEKYPNVDKLKNNNVNLQYNLYLMSLNSNNNSKEDEENNSMFSSTNDNRDKDSIGRSSNIDEDYEAFVLFYTVRRILKNHGKGYFVHLNKLTNWYKGTSKLNEFKNNMVISSNTNPSNSRENDKNNNNNTIYMIGSVRKYMFNLLFGKYRKNILHNIVNRFPELNQESYSTTKYYIKNSLVYFRIYDHLMWDIENKEKNSSLKRIEDKLVEGERGVEKYDENVETKDEEKDKVDEHNDGVNQEELVESEYEEDENNNNVDKDNNKDKKNGKNNNNSNNKKYNREYINIGDEKVVDRYIQSFEKVILESLSILIKHDQLAEEYEELIKYILYLGSYHYLKVLDCNYNLTNNVVTLIIESFEENKNDNREYKPYNKIEDEQFMRKVILFIIRLSDNLMLENNWNWNHLKLFENLVILFTKILRNTNYLNSLMTHKQGPSIFKNLLVVANSINIQESSFKVTVNMLNLAVLDRLLGLNTEEEREKGVQGELKGREIQRNRPIASVDNSLRSQDYAIKELESILISSCAKFKILCGKEEDKLALGTLSVLDLLIYQSFSQVFGAYQGLENKEKSKNYFKNFNLDLNLYLKMNYNNISSQGNRECNDNNKDNKEISRLRYGGEEKSGVEKYVEKRKEYRSRSNKKHDYVQNLFSNQLFYWNFLEPQYMLSLQFIGKLYLGFTLLPQTKLMLISEYFFLYASLKTNIKINKVKERFLTDNNLVRSESPMFMYEIYRMICCNSFI